MEGARTSTRTITVVDQDWLKKTSFTNAELVELALRHPEKGAVNFNILRILMHSIIKKLKIEGTLATMDDTEKSKIEAYVQKNEGIAKILESRRKSRRSLSSAGGGAGSAGSEEGGSVEEIEVEWTQEEHAGVYTPPASTSAELPIPSFQAREGKLSQPDTAAPSPEVPADSTSKSKRSVLIRDPEHPGTLVDVRAEGAAATVASVKRSVIPDSEYSGSFIEIESTDTTGGPAPRQRSVVSDPRHSEKFIEDGPAAAAAATPSVQSGVPDSAHPGTFVELASSRQSRQSAATASQRTVIPDPEHPGQFIETTTAAPSAAQSVLIPDPAHPGQFIQVAAPSPEGHSSVPSKRTVVPDPSHPGQFIEIPSIDAESAGTLAVPVVPDPQSSRQFTEALGQSFASTPTEQEPKSASISGRPSTRSRASSKRRVPDPKNPGSFIEDPAETIPREGAAAPEVVSAGADSVLIPDPQNPGQFIELPVSASQHTIVPDPSHPGQYIEGPLEVLTSQRTVIPDPAHPGQFMEVEAATASSAAVSSQRSVVPDPERPGQFIEVAADADSLVSASEQSGATSSPRTVVPDPEHPGQFIEVTPAAAAATPSVQSGVQDPAHPGQFVKVSAPSGQSVATPSQRTVIPDPAHPGQFIELATAAATPAQSVLIPDPAHPGQFIQVASPSTAGHSSVPSKRSVVPDPTHPGQFIEVSSSIVAIDPQHPGQFIESAPGQFSAPTTSPAPHTEEEPSSSSTPGRPSARPRVPAKRRIPDPINPGSFIEDQTGTTPRDGAAAAAGRVLIPDPQHPGQFIEVKSTPSDRVLIPDPQRPGQFIEVPISASQHTIVPDPSHPGQYIEVSLTQSGAEVLTSQRSVIPDPAHPGQFIDAPESQQEQYGAGIGAGSLLRSVSAPHTGTPSQRTLIPDPKRPGQFIEVVVQGPPAGAAQRARIPDPKRPGQFIEVALPRVGVPAPKPVLIPDPQHPGKYIEMSGTPREPPMKRRYPEYSPRFDAAAAAPIYRKYVDAGTQTEKGLPEPKTPRKDRDGEGGAGTQTGQDAGAESTPRDQQAGTLEQDEKMAIPADPGQSMEDAAAGPEGRTHPDPHPAEKMSVPHPAQFSEASRPFSAQQEDHGAAAPPYPDTAQIIQLQRAQVRQFQEASGISQSGRRRIQPPPGNYFELSEAELSEQKRAEATKRILIPDPRLPGKALLDVEASPSYILEKYLAYQPQTLPKMRRGLLPAFKRAPQELFKGMEDGGGGGAESTRPRCPEPTLFRKYYDRGEIPVSIDHNTGGGAVSWSIPPEELDYLHFLPLFFEGLRETEHPYAFLASNGLRDLLVHGGERVLPLLPYLVQPIREALNTRCIPILIPTIHALQQLIVSAPKVGEALVPYYRQLLPVLNIFKSKNINIGDEIEYGQYKRRNIGDLIQETLELMESYGGEDAFLNIKYMIPTYESIYLN